MSPSKSKEQEKFFNICAHDEKFAKEHHVSKELAQEWHKADKKKDKRGKKK